MNIFDILLEIINKKITVLSFGVLGLIIAGLFIALQPNRIVSTYKFSVNANTAIVAKQCNLLNDKKFNCIETTVLDKFENSSFTISELNPHTNVISFVYNSDIPPRKLTQFIKANVEKISGEIAAEAERTLELVGTNLDMNLDPEITTSEVVFDVILSAKRSLRFINDAQIPVIDFIEVGRSKSGLPVVFVFSGLFLLGLITGIFVVIFRQSYGNYLKKLPA